MAYAYIGLHRDRYRRYLILWGILVFIAVASCITVLLQVSPVPLWSLLPALRAELSDFGLVGQFLVNLIGGLFFIPAPQEVYFYWGITRGIGLPSLFIVVIGAQIISEFINYWLGAKYRRFFLAFFPKQKVYSAKRWLCRYGIWAIFLFNVVPMLPSQVLTFALGVARYNLARFYTVYITAVVIKLGVIAYLAMVYGLKLW